MMGKPMLTVCVTNYNYAPFVGAAIESALAQDYSHTEVVVVDDGSTDGSQEVIEGFGDRVVAVLQENAGHSSAMNAAFAAARGDVVLFLDADDALAPGLASRVMERFTRRPELAKVQYRLCIVDERMNPTGVTSPPPDWPMPSGDLRAHAARYRTYVWPGIAVAYRADVLRRLLPVPDDFHWKGVDHYLATLSVLCGPIESLDMAGYLYRIHGENHHLTKPMRTIVLDEIGKTRIAHVHARRLASEVGIEDYPERADDFLDSSFDAYRLAARKLWGEEEGSTLALAVRGARSALAHPHHPLRSKVKRALWPIAFAAAPRSSAERLAQRRFQRRRQVAGSAAPAGNGRGGRSA